ncbi:cAMP-binding domain of CRP or a regulatory subunit of cAMP-dependent protein kinases [Chryseobacterium taichungense]|uniref:cAMP-binding domain of CRP or a regulatory subunit of cAMP-dependent protein kinases n=1 Tax=Chryseobacterium taichungense TaxID=295069 RepID=A0A1H7YBM1_9FLAO|nr:Crp/Fnr family transcriptional regulator [Chryseobacterium taichungense]SEM42589.1 cAMP-binding domain of CRP or a regulatory subunit of cAMP-dependent protein kinases [Chryseobacterium taichungense]
MNINQDSFLILFNYIEAHSSSLLTSEDKEFIRELFVYKKIGRKQFFLKQGEICKYCGFIINGSMKQYAVDDLGKENVINLYLENWWVADRESLLGSKPTIYNIEACEDTEILMISQEGIKEITKVPALNELTKRLDMNHGIAMQNRINNAISLPAAERYNNLFKTHPAFLQRFPQHLIASYLGITKETLSRFRKHK